MKTASPRWCLELLALDFTEHFQGGSPAPREWGASLCSCLYRGPALGQNAPCGDQHHPRSQAGCGNCGLSSPKDRAGGLEAWSGPGWCLARWDKGQFCVFLQLRVRVQPGISSSSHHFPLISLSPRLWDYFSLQPGFCSRPALLTSCREVAIEKILKSKPDSAISLVKMT